jgi:hypothetical protein
MYLSKMTEIREQIMCIVNQLLRLDEILKKPLVITSRIEHKLLNGIRVSKMVKLRMRFVDVQVAHRQFGLTKMWKD